MTAAWTPRRRLRALLALGFALAGCSQPAAPPPQAAPRATRATPELEKANPFFELDAKPFCFAGANVDALAHSPPDRIDAVLDQAHALGLDVLRVAAHLDRGTLDGSVPSLGSSGGSADVYFQYWDREQGKPAYNGGATGLGRLDHALAAARRRGIKLLLVLTNNAPNFGGMEQYLTWYGLGRHADFYTDARVKQAYKDFLEHVVTRKNSVDGVSYRDDEAIFGWELANAPRTKSLGGMDSTAPAGSALVTAWADEMSRYVKSLDANHMVTAGGEGFFARQKSPWPYSGSEGVDQDALLALPAVDFGTFQLHPEIWRVGASFAETWIGDQLEAARRANKPVLLEAYAAPAPASVSEASAWNALLQRSGGSGALVSESDTPLTANEPLGAFLRGTAANYRTNTRACTLADGTRTGLGSKLVRARGAPSAATSPQKP